MRKLIRSVNELIDFQCDTHLNLISFLKQNCRISILRCQNKSSLRSDRFV